MNGSPLLPWGGPSLLVPMMVEVLIVTKESLNANWYFAPPNYNQLRTFLGPTLAPFDAEAPPNGFTGAIVYWSLPDAITHGTESSPAGTIVYPPVPNRWIVQRKFAQSSSPAAGTAEWAYNTWVVASDYVGGTNGTWFLNPNATLESGADLQFQLGGWWTLSQWQSPPLETNVNAHALSPPLTAVGAGDPAFAAFVPNVLGIFALPDDLRDLQSSPIQPGFLTYSVFGVYSDPANDPLYAGPDGWQSYGQWAERMEALEWSVGDDADVVQAMAASALWAEEHGFATTIDTLLPSSTICHGMVYNVEWPGLDGSASGVPTYSDAPVAIGVGHSGIDALTAMLGGAESSVTPAELSILEAFQYGNLPLAGSQAALDAILQGGWVSSTNTETVWEVVNRKGQPALASISPPPLTPEEALLLTALNVSQRALDECTAVIRSWQNQLYSLWWKNGALQNYRAWGLHSASPYQGYVDTATIAAKTAIDQQLELYSALQNGRDFVLFDLKSLLASPLRLRAGAGVPFLAPSDPVVMMSGIRRSFIHGEDARLASGGRLFCRFTGQTVASLTISPDVTVTAADFSPPLLQMDEIFGSAALVDEFNDLITECFFLDVTNAPVIAQAADPGGNWSPLEAIRLEQTLIWNAYASPMLDLQTLAEFSGLGTLNGLGAIPSLFAAQPWLPPWIPLFLQWEVNFVPATSESVSPMSPWVLGGNPYGALAEFDDFTYRYTGPPPNFSGDDTYTLRWMSLLTPQQSDVLAARIAQLIQNLGDDPVEPGDLQALKETLAYIQDADLLAQALSGFNLMLLQRNADVFRLPDDGSLDAWLSPPDGPQFQPLSTPYPTPFADPFCPIRAGHLQFSQLSVVDAFGQTFPVNLNEPAEQGTPTYLGADLTTQVPTPSVVELKPRITQFSRFLLTFLSATDDESEVGIAPGANPICGWIIPDYLDQSLLIYAADGELLGELLAGTESAIWNSPPNQAPAAQSSSPPSDIGNAPLEGLVAGILSQSDSGAAVAALIDLMQQAIMTLDPTGGWTDQELPALIGIPLAVVRASAAFELLGLPAWSQLWADSASPQTYGFEQVPFAVQLGNTELTDDGVVGYYVNDNYDQIRSVYSAPDAQYVSNNPFTLTLSDSALLTLIMAPSAAVYAITGIYPPLPFRLPAQFTTPALANMELLFRVGPILGQASTVGMPLPALREGTWSWLQYQDTTSNAVAAAVANVDATATLAVQPTVVREGWLQLFLGGPTTLFTYAVAPTAVNCSIGSPPNDVLLRITAYNGTGGAVQCSGIVFTFSIGTGPGDLTNNPAVLQGFLENSPPWPMTAGGDGTFQVQLLSPIEAPAGDTLTFVFSGIQVNSTPGTVNIGVTELTSPPRTGSVAVTKIG